jgi:hypothetical protein
MRTEFGWSERTAQRFMAVHEVMATRNDKLSDLAIDGSALLAHRHEVAAVNLSNFERFCFAPPAFVRIRICDGDQDRRRSTHRPRGTMMRRLTFSFRCVEDPVPER